ncbi:MAG: hypothetical protein ABFR89_12500 [Actinomycetota bacterium]
MSDTMIDHQLERFTTAVAELSPAPRPLSVPSRHPRRIPPVLAFASAFAAVVLFVGVGTFTTLMLRSSDDPTRTASAGEWTLDGYWEWATDGAIEIDPGVVAITKTHPTPRFDPSELGEVQWLVGVAEIPPHLGDGRRTPIDPVAHAGTVESHTGVETETQVLLYRYPASGGIGATIEMCTETRDPDLGADASWGRGACTGTDVADDTVWLVQDPEPGNTVAGPMPGHVSVMMLPRETSVVVVRLAGGQTFVQRPKGGVASIVIDGVDTPLAGSIEALAENGDTLSSESFGNTEDQAMDAFLSEPVVQGPVAVFLNFTPTDEQREEIVDLLATDVPGWGGSESRETQTIRAREELADDPEALQLLNEYPEIIEPYVFVAPSTLGRDRQALIDALIADAGYSSVYSVIGSHPVGEPDLPGDAARLRSWWRAQLFHEIGTRCCSTREFDDLELRAALETNPVPIDTTVVPLDRWRDLATAACEAAPGAPQVGLLEPEVTAHIQLIMCRDRIPWRDQPLDSRRP